MVLFLSIFSGCESYLSKEGLPNIVLKSSLIDFNAITEEILVYAQKFDNKITLGEVELVYKDLSLNDCTAMFYFSREVNDRKSESLVLDYDAKTKTITHYSYSVGLPKAVEAFDCVLQPKNWKLDLSQSLVAIQTELESVKFILMTG